MAENKKTINRTVLETLVYYKTLGTPLTLAQTGRLLISEKPLFGFSLSQVNEALTYWIEKGTIEKQKGLYWLKSCNIKHVTCNKNTSKEIRHSAGSDSNVSSFKFHVSDLWLKYIQREKTAQKKLYLVRKMIKLIRYFPGIQGVFVCGSVARKMSKRESDIDFLVLTEKNRVWTVRFFLTIYSFIFGRKTQDNKPRINKFCLNHYRSRVNLKLEENLQDLYSAQEYAQMINIYSRNKIENKFFAANISWMGKHIPNFNFLKPAMINSKHQLASSGQLVRRIIKKVGDLIEKIMQKLQIIIIQKSSQNFAGLDNRRIVVNNKVIMFHLNPRAPIVLKKYKNIVDKYNIL